MSNWAISIDDMESWTMERIINTMDAVLWHSEMVKPDKEKTNDMDANKIMGNLING